MSLANTTLSPKKLKFHQKITHNLSFYILCGCCSTGADSKNLFMDIPHQIIRKFSMIIATQVSEVTFLTGSPVGQ